MVIMHINLSIIETGQLFPTIHIEQNFLLHGPNHMMSLIVLESSGFCFGRWYWENDVNWKFHAQLTTLLSCYRNFYSNRIINLWNHYINAWGATLKIVINKIYLIHSVLIHQSQKVLNRSCTLSIYLGQPFQTYFFTGSFAFMIVVPIETEHSGSSRSRQNIVAVAEAILLGNVATASGDWAKLCSIYWPENAAVNIFWSTFYSPPSRFIIACYLSANSFRVYSITSASVMLTFSILVSWKLLLSHICSVPVTEVPDIFTNVTRGAQIPGAWLLGQQNFV